EELRDRVEADLRRVNQAKDEFLAMLGHELRNPIGAITSAVEVLERVDGGDPQGARVRAILSRQAAQMGRLVDDLLDVSPVTLGKIALRHRPTDLRDVAERAVESLRQTGRVDARELVVEAEPAMVVGDPTRLEQIVGNLLDNAVKYTPPGSRIRLSVR